MSALAAATPAPENDFGSAEFFRHPVSGVRYAKVLPGALYGTSQDVVIVTLLGSCVAACIRDPAAGIGGMNHFMLPGGARSHSAADASHRFGQSAMDTLIRCLVSHGARQDTLEVKLFGGGNMLERETGDSIGESNIRFAEDYLRDAGLTVAASDLGKHCPRKIHYNPLDGSVQVKRLAPLYRNIVGRQSDPA